MNSAPIKVTAATDDRTPEQAARAAPVPLPAGSYEAEDLEKVLNEAAKAKNDKNRDELVDAAVAKLNRTELPADSLGVPPGYKRVAVEDETLGVTENRVVFDPDQREEAEAAQADYQPPIQPGSADAAGAASKGE